MHGAANSAKPFEFPRHPPAGGGGAKGLFDRAVARNVGADLNLNHGADAKLSQYWKPHLQRRRGF